MGFVGFILLIYRKHQPSIIHVGKIPAIALFIHPKKLVGWFGWLVWLVGLFGWFGWFGFQPQGLQRQCESEADLKSNVWPRQARRGSEESLTEC